MATMKVMYIGTLDKDVPYGSVGLVKSEVDENLVRTDFNRSTGKETNRSNIIRPPEK